jgi:hypothetical protein
MMPLFYFHIVGARIVADNDGMELPDVAAAKRHAAQLGNELVRNSATGSGEEIQVTDEAGKEVYRLRCIP